MDNSTENLCMEEIDHLILDADKKVNCVLPFNKNHSLKLKIISDQLAVYIKYMECSISS